eukprot:jgi/Hompol1/1574/HPOL_005642-RA
MIGSLSSYLSEGEESSSNGRALKTSIRSDELATLIDCFPTWAKQNDISYGNWRNCEKKNADGQRMVGWNANGYITHLCRIGGTIPRNLVKLRHLVKLKLAENDFVGEIPPELAELTNLFVLDLSDNQLT